MQPKLVDVPGYYGPERRTNPRRADYERDKQAELNLQNSVAIDPRKLNG